MAHVTERSTMDAVEQADTTELDWIKARASMGNGACVELAIAGGLIALRDSKNPSTPPLFFTAAEFAAFVDGTKCGEFDHLLAALPSTR
jgi:hypothetical protein